MTRVLFTGEYMMSKYFLGIDQGGTQTSAVISDADGCLLVAGYESGLETVYFNDAEEVYIKRIVNASLQACTCAGITLESVNAVCAGLNGADWDFEYPILKTRVIKALGINDTIILNDCIAAMRGGSSEKNCAVVCAGTGLNIAVCKADGEKIIYGYYIDNAHQGAMALGSAALRKAIEAPLGLCSDTILTDMVLKYTQYDTTGQLQIDLSMGKYHLEAKKLAPLLIEVYTFGDYESELIISGFSTAVANYIFAALNRLSLSGSSLDIVFSGGLFKNNGIKIADGIFDIISKNEPGMKKIHARYEPVCGAVLILLVCFYDGIIPEGVMDNFDKSAVKLGLLRGV